MGLYDDDDQDLDEYLYFFNEHEDEADREFYDTSYSGPKLNIKYDSDNSEDSKTDSVFRIILKAIMIFLAGCFIYFGIIKSFV